jgi:uncharacterized protein (TIGR02147 family)
VNAESPNLFKYFDYQKFLLDYYQWRKSRHAYFSYRFISQKVGIDHGLLAKIIQGQRHLSLKSIPKICELLEFNKKKSEFFELLVLYRKAKTETELKQYFEKILAYSDLTISTLEKQKYEYFQKWYYAAIRETLNFLPVSDNFDELAQFVNPAITVPQAKKAVSLLEELGMIAKNSDGFYKITSQFITTDENWRSMAVLQFQKETLGLALDALSNIPKKERNISTVTLSIDEGAMTQINDRIKQFHTDLLSIANRCKTVNRAYQINLQVFPLSKTLAQGAKNV